MSLTPIINEKNQIVVFEKQFKVWDHKFSNGFKDVIERQIWLAVKRYFKKLDGQLLISKGYIDDDFIEGKKTLIIQIILKKPHELNQ